MNSKLTDGFRQKPQEKNRFSQLISDVINVLFIEKRLPYRLKFLLEDRLYRQKTEKAIEAVNGTPGISLQKPFKAEIHMLMNKKHVNMAILALKSFLRFFSNVCIVIHGDGSIDEDTERLLKHHIKGIRVIRLKDAEEIFKNQTTLFHARKGYLSIHITMLKLLDIHFLSNKNKLIIMDSDVIFTNRPDEIISWIEDNENCNLYARPYLKNLKMDKDALRNKFGPISFIEKFNSGLLCINKKLITLELILDTLEKLEGDNRMPVFGDESVWTVVFSRSSSRELAFDDYPLFSESRYLRRFVKKGKDEKMNYLHFILKHHGGFYAKFARRVVSDLRQ